MHCHKINTDTKSKETEIKRVINGEREKVKEKNGRRKSREEARTKRKEHMQRGKDRKIDVCRGEGRDEGRSSTSHNRDYLLLVLTGSHMMILGLLVGFRCKHHF